MGKRYKGKNTKNKKKKKVLITILIIFMVILGIVAGVLLSKYNYEELNKDDLGINENSLHSKQFVNIALFGVDSRKDSFEGRSDAIVVLTLDYAHNKIKLTSFMRDSLVSIEGHGFEKQTHAYAYRTSTTCSKNTEYKL